MSWAVQMLVSTSLLMGVVLLLRRPVAQLFGPRLAYALWLLPALRAALPSIPGWRGLFAPVFDLDPGTAPVGIGGPPPPDLVAAPMPMVDLPPPPAIAPSLLAQPDWPRVLLALWIGGAALWFAWQLVRYARFVRTALDGARLLATEQRTQIWISDRVEGPLAAGLVRRRIFLPGDFLTRYTSDERRMALLHEGAHHDRLDILANFAGLAFVALHWWNPLAHRAYRAFRTDQELACDATVLAGAAMNERHAYGSAILKSAVLAIPTAACALNHKTQIRRRIMMLKFRRASRARLAAGGLFATVLIGGGLLGTATGSIAAAAPPEQVRPVAPLAAVAPPPPPVAPAVPPAPVFRPRPPRAVHAIHVGQPVEIDTGRIERDAARAERDSERAQRDAERAVRHADVERQVAVSLAASRDRMAERCRAQGVAMPANADWSALATCNGDMQRVIRASLARAREAIRQTPSLSEEQRAAALAGVDRALANIDRDGAGRRD